MESKIEGFSFLIDPIFFSLGFLEIRWYSLMYFIGFSFVLFFVLREFKKQKKGQTFLDDIENILFWMFLFGLLGGRLGYVFFYDFSFFFLYPERIFLPFDTEGHYVGISGMSFHGGMIGASLALLFLCWKEKISLWKISDIIVLYFPIAIFFGRIGNFLNKELYGRQTNVPWGVDFGDGILRHPSQLYEAFLEGVILYLVLFFSKKKIKLDGILTVIFFISYGISRFFIEFFREPDEQLGYVFFQVLSLGQILSVIMVSIGFSFFFYIKRKEKTSLKLIRKKSS
ncbi:MAG: prolipoprotein diacylglyceryl transferase [Candidatus Moranbacteria bacterium]|nr:prolipoprotein diacylglyceryl transferase [Candidatus Moranbacteria bacterium]